MVQGWYSADSFWAARVRVLPTVLLLPLWNLWWTPTTVKDFFFEKCISCRCRRFLSTETFLQYALWFFFEFQQQTRWEPTGYSEPGVFAIFRSGRGVGYTGVIARMSIQSAHGTRCNLRKEIEELGIEFQICISMRMRTWQSSFWNVYNGITRRGKIIIWFRLGAMKTLRQQR